MTAPSSVPPTPDGSATAGSTGAKALDWWRRYCDPASEKVDQAIRARLRRARSHLDVLRVNPAVELARRLGAAPRAHAAAPWRVYATLDLARLLAHVKAHDEQHPMRAAGWKSFPGDKKESDAGEGERPKLSEARFKRLLETGDGEEKLLAFARLVTLLGGTVNVAQLASDFMTWNHPEYGDRVRERWAFEYLAAGSAAPPAPPVDAISTEDAGE
jgi:CRISPR system Cascade subunit CasB